MGRIEPEMTDDGRFIVVNGRRWRATDPNIPSDLKDELVRELMRARRAIKSGDDTARADVNAAKIALGERGEAWWEPTNEGRRTRTVSVTSTLLRARNGGPVLISDVARVVGGAQWQDFVELVADTISPEQSNRGWLLKSDEIEHRVVVGPESEM